jgi:hypothetical protein
VHKELKRRGVTLQLLFRMAYGYFYQRNVLRSRADPFNDLTIRDASTGEVTHAVGGKSSEGIKYMIAEVLVLQRHPMTSARYPSPSPPNQQTRCLM